MSQGGQHEQSNQWVFLVVQKSTLPPSLKTELALNGLRNPPTVGPVESPKSKSPNQVPVGSILLSLVVGAIRYC